MIEIKLGDRYAKSILDLAREKGELENVRDDFQLIHQVCESNPDFVLMLKSPLIFADKKQKIMDSIFGGKLSKITSKLVAIIISKRREAYLKDIAERYLHWFDIENNVTRGVLVSSHELNKEQVAKIVARVEKEMGTSFELELEIDPELIGGFELKVGDLLYDGSISGKLNKLSQEFDKNPYIKLT